MRPKQMRISVDTGQTHLPLIYGAVKSYQQSLNHLGD